MKPSYEKTKFKEGFKIVIGCDEVGRGSLAGPVVAAAVALASVESSKFQLKTNSFLEGKVKSWREVKDSKLLSPLKREKLSMVIKQSALAWAVSEVSNVIIDRINIHRASLLAMSRAIEKLLRQIPFKGKQVHIVVDGRFKVPGLSGFQEAVIDGDNKILSIAAASIIAKVYRDQLMRGIHSKYPVYNFFQHKGYGTLYHRKMIIKYNLCPIHRTSFCKKIIAGSFL